MSSARIYQFPQHAPRPPRHTRRHLFWRGIVAAAGNAAIAAGVYPVIPHARLLARALAERRIRADGPRGQARARGAVRTTLRGARTLGAEWSVALGLTAARPFGFLGLPGGGRRGPRPIVAVHGYAMSRANFTMLAGRLARAGLGPVLGFEYWTLGTVASAAHKLGDYVHAVCDATGAEAVDLIGHSMGGVVSRYYVALGGGSHRVRNMVTIASPHRGTNAAAASVGALRRELKKGSPLLARLDSAPPPRHTRTAIIWSRADGLVSRPESARIPADYELVFDDLGHLSMLASRRVSRAVVDLLSQ